MDIYGNRNPETLSSKFQVLPGGHVLSVHPIRAAPRGATTHAAARFQHHAAQARRTGDVLEAQGAGQPGEAGTDDHHVGLEAMMSCWGSD